jgi:probable rRNA maturation factor
LNCEITVQNLHPDCSIASAVWESWFIAWLAQPDLGLPAASGYELILRLTDDDEIQNLNAQYRQIDRPTDVLAFAALENGIRFVTDASMPLYLGDIVISVDTAKHQARDYEHSLVQELVWLASHGFLHLLGWDHQDDDSLMAMLQCQERLMGTIDVSATTVAVKP